MTKIELIKLIEKNENRIDKSVFVNENEGKRDLGTSQFRELAGICASAECFEEIKLLIEYNIAKNTVKDKNKKSDKVYKNSWAKEKEQDGVSIGKVIIECMEDVQKKSKESKESEEELMKNLSLFFGYMYWKARIWATRKQK